MIQVIHISDSHVGPSVDSEINGVDTFARLERLIDEINSLEFSPDLVIHSGDVTNDPTPEAYAVAAKALAKLKTPAYFVTGNHDDAAMMRELLTTGPAVPLAPDPDRIFCRIDLPGHKVFLIDAKVPEAEGPHGKIPEAHLEILEAQLAGCSESFSLFVHFPVLPIGSPWIDEHLPLENGSDLHALLLRAGNSRNRGVFFGHLHRGLQIYRDGILYSAVSSPAFQFTAGPNDETIAWSNHGTLPFNHITFTDQGTAVKEHVVLA